MMKLILMICSLAALGACSIVGEPIAGEVANVITEYCEREPYQARTLYRDTINAELAGDGHDITVTCAGDPVEELEE